MRLLFTLTGCCLTLLGLAQTPRQSLRIQISYEKAGSYIEQAVETIEATNTIGSPVTVTYQAGQSIVLSPGFEAKAGSTFTADIKPISGKLDVSLQLSAFPNPFDQATTIDYYLPADGKVNLYVTDMQGKIVGHIVQAEVQSAGQHRVEWKPETAGVGVYIPIVEANQQRAATRVVKK